MEGGEDGGAVTGNHAGLEPRAVPGTTTAGGTVEHAASSERGLCPFGAFCSAASPGGLRAQPRLQPPPSCIPPSFSPPPPAPPAPHPSQPPHLPMSRPRHGSSRGAGEEAAAALNKGRAVTRGGRAAAVGTCPQTRRGGETQGGREEGEGAAGRRRWSAG